MTHNNSTVISERARREARLLTLEDKIIQAILALDVGIVEGTVMSPGPAPYRRLDCGGRALVYLKRRPSKRAVRLDVSGLWRRPRETYLSIPSASGATTLLVHDDDDVEEAVSFVEAVVCGVRRAA